MKYKLMTGDLKWGKRKTLTALISVRWDWQSEKREKKLGFPVMILRRTSYRRYWEYRETPQLPVISWFSDHVPYLCWRILLSTGESEKIHNPQTHRRIAWWTDRWRTQNHSRNDWRYHEIQGDGKQIGFSFSFSLINYPADLLRRKQDLMKRANNL